MTGLLYSVPLCLCGENLFLREISAPPRLRGEDENIEESSLPNGGQPK
jgi:hypothetical protein